MTYDAIVVGSGFGAAVAALGLAQKGKRILILERGTFWITPQRLGLPPTLPAGQKTIREYLKDKKLPVQYWVRPNHQRGLLDFLAAVRSSANKDGLYQYSMFKQADVLTANAVGGGSMIYSNVTLRPKPAVLNGIQLNLGDNEFAAGEQWIETQRGKLNKIVTKIPLPNHKSEELDNLTGNDEYLYLDRTRELKRVAPEVAAKLGIQLKWEPLKLAVVEYEEDDNHHATGDAKKNQTHCQREGRCFLGCLPSARNTLNKMIYGKLLREDLPHHTNVTLSPMSKVLHFERLATGNYKVTYRDDRDDGDKKTAEAPLLFLGAGVMGTTEIMLRSQGRGMKFSDKVGTHFSTNGDFAGFAVDTKRPVYSTRGPINTCHLATEFQGSHITIEDCAVPEMFASVTRTVLQILDNAAKSNEFKNKMKLLWEFRTPLDLGALFPSIPDTYDPNSYQTEAEMVSNTLFFNAMGVDDASGQLSIDSFDNLKLDWPDKKIADNPVFQRIETLFKAITEQLGGRYVSFPLWKGLGNRKLVVVHPLGGCPLAPTKDDGVVDEFGRVFDGSKGPGSTAVLPGLYIVDGAVIPGALAANPSLTITAQAIKSVTKALA